MKIDWKGKETHDRVVRAVQQAVDDTTADAVARSRGIAPVKTGALRSSLRAAPARIDRNYVIGTWGSFSIHYAIYVELGRYARPYLRPAADATYSRLKDRIRERMNA
jgi:hypothetical protein